MLILSKNHKKEPDTLHVTRTGFKGHFNVIGFIDADTQQNVMLIKSFNISSYGETPQKASEMLNQSIKDFFEYLFDKSSKERISILQQLGWKQDREKHKNFSKAHVDKAGNLQGMNAVQNSIEEFALTA